MISGNLDALGKNGLRICIQQEKSYQNYELFFLGLEKVLKMQASVICKHFDKQNKTIIELVDFFINSTRPVFIHKLALCSLSLKS